MGSRWMYSSFRYQTCKNWLKKNRILIFWIKTDTFKKTANEAIHLYHHQVISKQICILTNGNIGNFFICILSLFKWLELHYVIYKLEATRSSRRCTWKSVHLQDYFDNYDEKIKTKTKHNLPYFCLTKQTYLYLYLSAGGFYSICDNRLV